jgi:hypothetical protein
MQRNEIFVSYSHRDRRWLDELLITLAPLIRKRNIEVWDDTKIQVGKKWKAEIRAALGRAKIAVLLVTRNFLASKFIATDEMPQLLEAAEKEGLIVTWIAVGYSLYEQTEITEYQAANEPSRPLNSLSEADADRELVRIAGILNAFLSEPEAAEPAGPSGAGSEVPEVEATLPDILLDQIVGNGPLGKRKTEHAKGIIGRFVDDAFTPAHRRMRDELAEGKWAWRSIHALAAKAGVDEKTALDILRADPEVVLGRSKAGKTIVRLRTSVGV